MVKKYEMIYKLHLPALPICNFVDKIIYIEGNNKGTGLPKTAMSMVFNLGDAFKWFHNENFDSFVDYRKYWVAGLQTRPTHVESYGESKMIVIQFNTLGASAFLKEPLFQFTDQYINMDCVYAQEVNHTWQRLMEARCLDERFMIIENFLLSKLIKNKAHHHKFSNAIALLLHVNMHHSINQVCKDQNISRKHLSKLSKEFIGVPPKMATSLLRFQNTLKTISTSNNDKLTDVAYKLDYFDQSHFNNDFKRFTNLKPSEYVKLVENFPTLKIVPHFIPYLQR